MAKGFSMARARVEHVEAEFITLGGIDVDRAACADFKRITGVPATVLDLMDVHQYRAFYGKEPPAGWREATPDDIRRAFQGQRPHIIATSPPCKGFSGLLSEQRSTSAKYQALNRLTLRGIALALEAYEDDLPEFFVLENVPRIATRGRHLVDAIAELWAHHGYSMAETTHDCGELGELAQTRKRFLMVARHRAKVPPFLYQPQRKPLRAVGEVLGAFPLPGHPSAGVMHRMRSLQWKTWVRLAFVKAGGDWRSLQELRVADGHLADYAIMPETYGYPGALGVTPWDAPSATVTAQAHATRGAHNVADPRSEGLHHGVLGVTPWSGPAGVVASSSRPCNGRFAVADPRTGYTGEYSQLGILPWDETAGAVSGQSAPGGGRYAVADPRVTDPRLRPDEAGPRFNNVYRVVSWAGPGPAVTGGGGPSAGGLAVADPRTEGQFKAGLGVTPWEEAAGTVTGEAFPTNGRFAVADPRPNLGGEDYKTAGHYGVVPWDAASRAVTGTAGHDNGPFNVADPRGAGAENPAYKISADFSLPAADARLVAVIRSLDGTWHRPFTTLELAALQGLVAPGEHLELHGSSDSAWRERIGNACPPAACAAIGGVMGTALLLAWAGETFVLSADPIWCRPLEVLVAVDGGSLM